MYNIKYSVSTRQSCHLSQLPPRPMLDKSLRRIYRQGIIDIGKARNITKLLLNQCRFSFLDIIRTIT